MIPVSLTETESLHAAEVGLHRQLASRFKRLKDRHGFQGLGWNEHIEGAAGEMAFAKAFYLYYPFSINRFKDAPDVGPFEIRTRIKHDHDLIVRPGDQNRRYVLVTGMIPDFQIHGWIDRRNVKEDWLRSYGGREPAYFCPQNQLNNNWNWLRP